MDGAGFPGDCSIEGLVENPWNEFGFLNSGAPLGDGLEEFQEEIFRTTTMKAFVCGPPVDRPGDMDDWRRGVVSLGDSRNRICRAGAGGGDQDAGPPGKSSVHIGHDGTIVLVFDRDVANRSCREDRIKGINMRPWHPKDHLHIPLE